MYDLVRLVRRQQLRFRLFLRVAVDAARVREQARLAEEREAPGRKARAEAVKRAEERTAWALKQRADWKAMLRCVRELCPLCGLAPHPGSACDERALWYERQRRALRRMCRSNGSRSSVGCEWRDWNSGVAGGRACGPASWDNAVRAIEDG